MMTLTKILAGALLLVPMMARGTLTSDGEKYLAEAKKRIAKIEKEIDADKVDAAKASSATEDLLSSKRFLDNVQKEQPKNEEAAKLQAEADKLLETLKPAMLKAEIDRRLTELDGVLGKIETQLGGTRDAAAERELDNRFDGVRAGLKAVLEKDPKNERALAEKTREDALWQKLMQQRQAAAKGGK